MFGSDILDIAIGVVFIFLLLSLLCSAVNEFIESLFKYRAKNLERGIAELLGDPGHQTGFLKALYNHGLVNSLFKGTYQTAKSEGNLPSYIPSRSFALAVIDLVRNPPAGVTLPPNLESMINMLQGSTQANAGKLEASFAEWYDSAMDQVSGWYKRRTQLILFIVGLIVAIAVNADTVNIVQSLSNDSSLRKGIVAAAQARASKAINALDDVDTEAKIKQDLASLKGLGLPLGWDGKPDDHQAPRWVPHPVIPIYRHLFGWFLTSMAISMGAPFWFDLLNRFVVIRSTVKPHEKSEEEGSKDGKDKS